VIQRTHRYWSRCREKPADLSADTIALAIRWLEAAGVAVRASRADLMATMERYRIEDRGIGKYQALYVIDRAIQWAEVGAAECEDAA